MESACQCRVLSLGQEDPLEEEMVPHSNISAWNPIDRGAPRATIHGIAELNATERLNTHTNTISVNICEHWENTSSDLFTGGQMSPLE